MFMDIDSRAAQNRPLDLEQISGWANEFRQQELALKLIDQLYVQTLANHFNSELEQRYSELNQQYSKLNQQYSELNQRHSELEQQDIQLHQSIEEILSSTCWKITLPLRWLGLFVKRFKART
jgi:predicted nuclease with TOPRIM domain